MEEFFRIIPDNVAAVIESRLSVEKLSELRVRNGLPIGVCYGGKYYFLGPNGLTTDDGAAFRAGNNEAENIIMRACGRSLYTVTDTIRKGYISIGGGIRIGVCGTAVMNGDVVAAVKNFSSVNIRLPHEVRGAAHALFGAITSRGRVSNTLIISPPGAGKTTVLRDLCRMVSNGGCNVLLCDEKFELAAAVGGVPTLDVGNRTDIICGETKRRVFAVGIAYMRPDVIMTDELFEDDIEPLERAVHCGIAAVATVHARDVDDFLSKREYRAAIDARVFEYYAVLHGPPDHRITISSASAEEVGV